jgi:DNA ligase (NAD+)
MYFLTHQAELDYLKKLGFPVNPLNTSAKDIKEVWQKSEELNQKKESLKYPVDGMVVKLNDLDLVEKLGIVGKTKRAWSAIKFPAIEITTKLQDITWQIGRTGRVIPVAELEPTLLEGTTVKRATLHNFQEFLHKDLKKEDVLIIRKAGDIIPEVVQVLTNLRAKNLSGFDSPIYCPCCKTKLVKSKTEVDLYCPNAENCPDQILGRLAYFSQRNIGNIKGFSRQNIKKFMEIFKIKDIYDLYNLPFSEIFELDGFGQKSVENLKDSLQESREISAEKFLAGLSIEGVGVEVAKLILQKIYAK